VAFDLLYLNRRISALCYSSRKRQTAETPEPATVTNPFLDHVENDGKATDREDESGRNSVQAEGRLEEVCFA
jgi:hypothetical protein